jgi:hypothetical protein
MRCRTRFLITLWALVPSAALATSRDRDGQYFCYVDQVAGIKFETGKPTLAGKIRLPDNKMKLFIMVRPVVIDEVTRTLCTNTIEYLFKEYVEKGIAFQDKIWERNSKNLWGQEAIGRHCFASEEITVTYPGDRRAWTYRGYGDSAEYFGVSTGDWFNFYGGDGGYSFGKGFPYDDGPVVEYGHCTKIEPPK